MEKMGNKYIITHNARQKDKAGIPFLHDVAHSSTSCPTHVILH